MRPGDPSAEVASGRPQQSGALQREAADKTARRLRSIHKQKHIHQILYQVRAGRPTRGRAQTSGGCSANSSFPEIESGLLAFSSAWLPSAVPPTGKRGAEVEHLEVISLRGSARPRALADKPKHKLLRPVARGVEPDNEHGKIRRAPPGLRSKMRTRQRRSRPQMRPGVWVSMIPGRRPPG